MITSILNKMNKGFFVCLVLQQALNLSGQIRLLGFHPKTLLYKKVKGASAHEAKSNQKTSC